jgi:hypothetical protein
MELKISFTYVIRYKRYKYLQYLYGLCSVTKLMLSVTMVDFSQPEKVMTSSEAVEKTPST